MFYFDSQTWEHNCIEINNHFKYLKVFLKKYVKMVNEAESNTDKIIDLFKIKENKNYSNNEIFNYRNYLFIFYWFRLLVNTRYEEYGFQNFTLKTDKLVSIYDDNEKMFHLANERDLYYIKNSEIYGIWLSLYDTKTTHNIITYKKGEHLCRVCEAKSTIYSIKKMQNNIEINILSLKYFETMHEVLWGGEKPLHIDKYLRYLKTNKHFKKVKNLPTEQEDAIKIIPKKEDVRKIINFLRNQINLIDNNEKAYSKKYGKYR